MVGVKEHQFKSELDVTEVYLGNEVVSEVNVDVLQSFCNNFLVKDFSEFLFDLARDELEMAGIDLSVSKVRELVDNPENFRVRLPNGKDKVFLVRICSHISNLKTIEFAFNIGSKTRDFLFDYRKKHILYSNIEEYCQELFNELKMVRQQRDCYKQELEQIELNSKLQKLQDKENKEEEFIEEPVEEEFVEENEELESDEESLFDRVKP